MLSSLLLVLLFQFCSHTYGLQSFGFTLSNYDDIVNGVIIRLYWGSLLYQCTTNNITLSGEAVCVVNSTSTMICDNTGYVSPLYQISIVNNNTVDLLINTVFVTINPSFKYILNSFCIDDINLNIAINNISSSQCTQFNNEISYNQVLISNSSDTALDILFPENITINTPTSGKVTLLINIDFSILCPAIKVKSFGFITHRIYSQGNIDSNTLTLTVYWGKQKIIYSIPDLITTENKTYLYDASTMVAVDTADIEYKIQFNIIDNTVLRITAVFITDIYDNTYFIEDFCGPEQFYYFHSGYENEIACIYPDYPDRYNYDYIKIGTGSTILLSRIYVTFKQGILFYPNTNQVGLLSPAQIKTFGFKTSSLPDANTPNNLIRIQLYWDSFVYSCTLGAAEIGTEYQCNSTTFTKYHTDCSKFVFEIQNDHNDAVRIDEIFIKDESSLDVTYYVTSFCSDSTIDPVFILESAASIAFNNCPGQDSSVINQFHKTDGLTQVYTYESWCMDNQELDCVYPMISVDLSIEIFKYGDLASQGFIYPVTSFDINLCNNGSVQWTDNPTTMISTTISPTANPVTSAPTLMSPTLTPTNVPTTMGPTMTPTNVVSTSYSTSIDTSIQSSTPLTLHPNTHSPSIIPSIYTTVQPSTYSTKTIQTTVILNTSKTVLISTEGKEGKTEKESSYDYTWIFIVVGLTIIVVLVAALVFCGMYVKHLKKRNQTPNAPNLSSGISQVPVQQITRQLTSDDGNAIHMIPTDIITTGSLEMTNGIAKQYRDKYDANIEGVSPTHENINQSPELIVINASHDDEVIGDDINTPTGGNSLNSVDFASDGEHKNY